MAERDELAVIILNGAYELWEHCVRCDKDVYLSSTTTFTLLELVEAAEKHAREFHG